MTDPLADALSVARDEGILDEVVLVVMSPATRATLNEPPLPKVGLGAGPARNERSIPIEIDPLWVGPPRCLTAEGVEDYRQGRRSLDKRFNPDWRLKT